MPFSQSIDLALSRIRDRALTGEEPDPYVPESLLAALEYVDALVALAAAVRDERAAVAETVAPLLADGVKVGPRAYRVDRRTAPRPIPEPWWQLVGRWLEESPVRSAKQLWSPSTARIGAVKRLAAAAGLDPAAVEDTVYEREEAPPKISVVPITHAPKFLQNAPDGEPITRRPT